MLLSERSLLHSGDAAVTEGGRPAVAASLLAIFCCGPALADDWYTGATRVVPGSDWIVAVDASTTLTTNQSQFAYAAGTIAVGGGTLQQSGFRLKLEGLGGTYGYQQGPLDSLARGEQFEGGALAGYQQEQRGRCGLCRRQHPRKVPAADTVNSATGTKVGFKTALDAYLRPTDQTSCPHTGRIQRLMTPITHASGPAIGLSGEAISVPN
jgi:hypothetical protein